MHTVLVAVGAAKVVDDVVEIGNNVVLGAGGSSEQLIVVLTTSREGVGEQLDGHACDGKDEAFVTFSTVPMLSFKLWNDC